METRKQMKFNKKESVSGTYAKKGQDINDGDFITINSAGKIVEGQFGSQNVFEIKTAKGEFLMSFNQTSINSLVDAFGEESENWIGKKVAVHSIKQNVAGKFINVYYVAPEGYEMGENGFEKIIKGTTAEEEVPIIGEDGEVMPPF